MHGLDSFVLRVQVQLAVVQGYAVGSFLVLADYLEKFLRGFVQFLYVITLLSCIYFVLQQAP